MSATQSYYIYGFASGLITEMISENWLDMKPSMINVSVAITLWLFGLWKAATAP